MKFFNKAQDPMSSLTHALGACLGIVYLLILQLMAFSNQSDFITHCTLLIFSLSVIALYSASSYYHYIQNDHPSKQLFRKLDHSLIYVLIAGSYTPVAMHFLEPGKNIMFTTGIWAIALLGIVSKILWLHAPRILYTLLYLLMGWAVVLDWKGFSSMPLDSLKLLALGGLWYTIGAIIYIIKKPNLSPSWGFHELFHIFILLGTFTHFIVVALYIA